jgi:hypothetical protein
MSKRIHYSQAEPTVTVVPLVPQSVLAIEPVALDIKLSAAFLNTSVRQIRTLIYKRELTPVLLGKKQLLLVADLRKFIEARRRAA